MAEAEFASLDRDGVSAIRDRLPERYGQLTETYLEALLAFPAAWARYRALFTPQAAADRHPFGLGLLERVFDDVRGHVRTAARADQADVVRKVGGFAYRLLDRAVPVRAAALVSQALDLFVAVYVICRYEQRTTPSPAVVEAADQVADLLFDSLEYTLEGTLRSGSLTPELRDASLSYLGAAFGRVSRLLKESLDAGDVEGMRKRDGAWSEIGESWHPDEAHPNRWDLQMLQKQLPANSKQMREAEAAAAVNESLDTAKRSLEVLRGAYRLGLASWALRQHVRTQSTAWAGALAVLAGDFGSIEDLNSAAGRALEIAQSPSDPWIQWYFDESKARTMWGGAEVDLLRAYLYLGSAMTPAQSHVDPSSPLVDTHDELERLSQQMSNDPVIVALGGGSRADGMRQVVEAVVAASQERQTAEAHRVRAASLDPVREAGLRRDILAGWQKHRLAPGLFRLANAYAETRDTDAEVHEFGFAATMPKEWLVAGARIETSFAAEQMGDAVARGEMREFLRVVAQGAKLDHSLDAKALREGVTAAIDRVRAEGLMPSAVLLYPQWRVERALDPEGRTELFGDPSLPSETRHWFLRPIAGVPAVDWPDVEPGRIWVIDLAKLASWTQFLNSDGGALRIGVVELQADEGEPQVRIEVFERFRIATHDVTAARFLTIPRELQGED